MNSDQIREKFLNYFKSQNHVILESASVITKDEKGVTNATLFNTAGVQPIIPNVLAGSHPLGNRLASAQKCIRTIDIDSVGDKTHLTFFEMLGNWSLGDYFKEDAIRMSFEFLTDKNSGLGLDPNRLYVTVFSGNTDAPRDEEAFQIWQKYLPEDRIFYLESNWWEAGENGPCGPDTEMFYDMTEEGLGSLNHQEFLSADENQNIVEIWNNVFMQYEKQNGQVVGKLQKHAVDTGAGLERIVTILNKKDSVYDTDVFENSLKIIKENSKQYNDRSARIIADHLRASIIMLSDGAEPSNTDRGYVLRKIIRRAIRHINLIDFNFDKLTQLIENQIEKIGTAYSNVIENKVNIINHIQTERNKFQKALEEGLKEFTKIKEPVISGETAFKLFSSYGLPIELIDELAKEKGISVDLSGFEKEFSKHQELSRNSSVGKFKGGLEGHSEIEIKYHTATHLLHQALHDVLGDHVEQKGSNINPERLRFDFSHTQKMTPEEIKQVEEIVNQKIKDSLTVNKIEIPKDEALKTGARHSFNEKYGDIISIYYIGSDLENAYSKEFCGGPHVKNTNELGQFKIAKEEAVSQGVRRIKATLS